MRFSIFVMLAAAAAGQQVITTFAGSDWVFTDDGKPGKQAALALPIALGADANSNVYIVDPLFNSVLKLDTKGIITIVAGNSIRQSAGDGGLARAALLANPASVAVDADGNIYIAEVQGSVRKVSPDGIINRFAGGQNGGILGDGGPALNASIGGPNALAVDGQGNVYIREGSGRIRKVDRRASSRRTRGKVRPELAETEGLPLTHRSWAPERSPSTKRAIFTS